MQVLQQHGYSVSTQGRTEKRRKITFTCAIAGDGYLTCTVLKFADTCFEDTEAVKYPIITKVEEHFYIILYKYGMDEELLHQIIYSQAIVPEVVQRRRTLKSDPNIRLIPRSELDLLKYSAIGIDGADGPIKAIENFVHSNCQSLSQNVIFAKYAAGTSLTQSANDQGVMHSTLKKCFQDSKFKYPEVADPIGGSWLEVKRLLSRIDSSSFNSVWKCMKLAPTFISKAFNRVAIISAFDKVGLFMKETGRFCENTILQHCPHFNQLSPEDKSWLRTQLPRFYETFNNNRILDENVFKILEDKMGIDNSPNKTGMPLREMVTNRQRCLIIGDNTHFQRMQQRLAEESKEQETTTKRKRAIRCQHCRGKIAVSDECHSCSVPNCNFRYCCHEMCKNVCETHKIAHNETYGIEKPKQKRKRVIIEEEDELGPEGEEDSEFENEHLIDWVLDQEIQDLTDD